MLDSSCDPKLVMLDIGTNDLAGHASPIALAEELLEVARAIVTSTASCSRVVIFGPLYRTVHGRHGAHPHFNERVKAFNHYLQVQLRDSDHIHFWYHKGLSSRALELVVDGVHLGEEGLRKYIRSLRRAVMKFTADMVV